MRNVVGLLLLAFSFGATAAAAQQLPPGMTMHRLQAGVLDQSGWALADSTEGAFSVTLPCTFNDFTMDQSTLNTPVTMTFTVGCRRPDQRRFSATRFQYQGGANDAHSFFEKNASGENWPGVEVATSTFKGLPVVDVKAENQAQCGILRFVLAQPDILLLVAEAPKANCAGLEAQSAEFFESLIVRQR
jgi:hypothetical protein